VSACVPPLSGAASTARSRWDGAMRRREWLLVAVGVAALPIVLPPSMCAVIAMYALVAYVVGASSLARRWRLSIVLGATIAFVAARQVLRPPPVPFVLWAGIGISAFLILRCVDYALARHERSPEESVADSVGRFLLYVFFLPLLFAGPVLTYGDLYRSYAPTSAFDRSALARHLGKIATGCVKFYVAFPVLLRIAQGLERAAVGGPRPGWLPDGIPSMALAWGGVATTLVFVYVSFSGFSDIGTGIARILGFQVYENFEAPLLAPSPPQFWKRSNISTYRWLMTHVFFPCFDHDQVALKIAATFFVSGLWHVAAVRVLTLGSASQMMAALLINGLAVLVTLRLFPGTGSARRSWGAGGRGRQIAAVAATFLFTAVVFDVFWAGITNRPLAATFALLRALVPGA
jgi:D-alanyl-lipoteichoic acid acyltransferase DltB (MBOAT superfamily)